ncbi:GCC1 protein, partial [Atractosteus spatula]|nr:GCC1 protein [Atractosteus spatula]
MEKFGMNFGGGPSKKELLETVESLKKQLVQYQTRFKDVVRAYKSLLKEKEALEASLKVLTVSQEADLSYSNETHSGASGLERRSSDLGDDKCSLHSEDSVDTAASVDTANSVASSSTKGEVTEEEKSLSEHGPAVSALQRAEDNNGSESGVSSSSGEQQVAGETDRRVLQLKAQLSTLTSSLATVTQEKSRMEASFQADKKKVKQDLEDLCKSLEEERSHHEAEVKSLQEQLAEAKARVITQQHERAQEQGDHALMLQALVEKMTTADRVGDYEAQVRVLSTELEEMRKALVEAEREKCKPDPRVGELQQEIEDLKAHFQLQIQQEMRKAGQAEERLREQSQLEESRLASLEERVSELSELLGTYEKAKQKDQLMLQKLKDRIMQLDMENKTLAFAASARTSVDLTIDETNLDVNVLKEKMVKVRKLLLLATQKSQQPLEIETLCDAETAINSEHSDGEKASVVYYQQELKQLKDEFERYKMRAQVVLKNKTVKDGNLAKELEEVRDQLSELKEKYISLRLSCDEMENKHKQELESRQQYICSLQQSHKQELERLEAEYRERFLKLEEELHKQRDRTLALLTEKDQELERFRSMSLGYGLGGHKKYSDNNPTEMEINIAGDTEDDSTQDVIAQALKMAGPTEPTLLLYAEQLARKEVEISALRKQKHRLEGEIHQLQDTLLTKEERHSEEVAVLREQIEKYTRDQSREGANLEYLKNIIYRFLTLQDSRGRQQTLTAILTILHFSPQEKQAVVKQQVHSWWNTGMR